MERTIGYCTYGTHGKHHVRDIATVYADATAVVGHLVSIELSLTPEAEDRRHSEINGAF